MHGDPLRRSSPLLRLASLSQVRRLGLDNALALAANTGFERVEIPASDLVDGDSLRSMLVELGLRASAVAMAWEELDADAPSHDPVAICRRAEQVGCHRLVVSVARETAVAGGAALARQLDAVAYRLAGRSAELTIRLEGGAAEEREPALRALLRELSQSSARLELESLDLDLFTPWADRTQCLALSDRMLLEPPVGSWGEPRCPGGAVLEWLRPRPWIELTLRHERGALDEGPALTGARTRWRREIENRDPPRDLRPRSKRASGKSRRDTRRALGADTRTDI